MLRRLHSLARPSQCFKLVCCTAVAALAVSAAKPLRLHAQQPTALGGRVVDAKSRAPLDGAELTVTGTNARAYSGTDGTWQISGVFDGPQLVRVRRIGYSNSEVTIAVPGDGARNTLIALTPSPRPLDAVVVTAARHAQRLEDAPVMTKLIDRKDIEESGASDVAAVLTEQTGVQFTGGHPSGSGVGLEGMSDQHVLVLLDGVPLYGRIADGLDLTRVPASAVERIEVVKGPQSTLYGSEAMGGVVNIITRGAGIAAPDFEVSALVGSGQRSDLHVFGAGQLGSLATALNIGTRHMGGAPGIAATSGAFAERRDGMGSIRWTPDGSLALDASALIVSERQRWPNAAAYDFADNTQSNARLHATWLDGSSRLTSTLALSQLDHLSRLGQPAEPVAGTGDRQVQRLAQADVLYTRPVSGAVIDIGSQLRQEYIMSTDGRVAGGSRTLMSAEPYAQADWSIGRWSIVPGARVSWSEQYGLYVSPRVATRFRVDSSLTLRASAGRGFRAPDFKELYLDFTNAAASYAVHGNAALRPEHADNLSTGAQWTGARSYVSTLLYWNRLRDFIETQPVPGNGQIAQYTYGNIAESTTRGVETETGVTFGSLRTDLGYAYLFSRDRSTNGPLLNQPSQSGRVRVSGSLPLGLRASAIGVYTGRTPMKRASDGSISSTRDPFTRVDLRVARRSFGNTDLSIGIENVFNTHPARWADATQRQVYAGATWHARNTNTHEQQ